jgi:hypothetical protein
VDAKLPACVHLRLDSAQEVLCSFAHRLRRIQDGGLGPRRLSVSCQYPLLRSSVLLSPDPRDAVCKTSVFSILFLIFFSEGRRSREGQLRRAGLCRKGACLMDSCEARPRGQLPHQARLQVCVRRRHKGGHREEIAISV